MSDMPLKDPAEIETMVELRAQIDRLDTALIDLLALRQAHVDRAAQIKTKEGLPARIPSRVNEVLDNIEVEALRAGFEPLLARQMWAMMVEDMIAREERVLGPDAVEDDAEDKE